MPDWDTPHPDRLILFRGGVGARYRPHLEQIEEPHAKEQRGYMLPSQHEQPFASGLLHCVQQVVHAQAAPTHYRRNTLGSFS